MRCYGKAIYAICNRLPKFPHCQSFRFCSGRGLAVVNRWLLHVQLSAEDEMSQTVTLNLPDNFFQPVRRTAEAMNQTIEEILLTALQASLPSLDGLPEEIVENLTTL